MAERPRRDEEVEAEPGMRRTIGMLGQELSHPQHRSTTEKTSHSAAASTLSGTRRQIRSGWPPLLEEMGIRGRRASIPGALMGEKQPRRPRRAPPSATRASS